MYIHEKGANGFIKWWWHAGKSLHAQRCTSMAQVLVIHSSGGGKQESTQAAHALTVTAFDYGA